MEVGDKARYIVNTRVFPQDNQRYLGSETIAPMPPASKPLRIAPTLMMAAMKKDRLFFLMSLKWSISAVACSERDRTARAMEWPASLYRRDERYNNVQRQV